MRGEPAKSERNSASDFIARIFLRLRESPAILRERRFSMFPAGLFSPVRTFEACPGMTEMRLLCGQASWQMSQPYSFLVLRIMSCNFFGICFLFSIVKYEMHLRASITPGAIMAFVGHASMQRVQVPQRGN